MNSHKKKPAYVAKADWDAVDSPPPSVALMAKMRPASEAVSDVVAGFKKARGRPRAAFKKVPVTIRLNPEVVTAFKAAGPGWQTKINSVLMTAVHHGATGGKISTGVKSLGVKSLGIKSAAGTARRARTKI